MSYNTKDKTMVYLMPGMAASPRIFEFIKLPPEFILQPLSWIPPKKKESLAAYAARMTKRIQHKHPILIGVSFGGILVQEIAKLISCKQVIIVSSVKSNTEFSRFIQLARSTGAYKLLPTQWIQNLESLCLFVFGKSIQSRVEAYQKYLSERDPNYLNWSIDKLVHWDQHQAPKGVIHTHGDKDSIFPIHKIEKTDQFYSIDDGSHAIILTHHKWFNTHLPNLINTPVAK